MERWYTSDSHYGHANIIKYANRPFTTADEMDKFLLQMWNQVVKPEDHISHLGDVTMARSNQQREPFVRWMKLHNGHKRLYLGNHDHFEAETYIEAGFEHIYGTWRTQEGILFSHIPIHPQSLGSAVANVHGHIHEKPAYVPHTYERADGSKGVIPYVNICVEATDYLPIHLDEVLKRIRLAKGASDTWMKH